MTREYEQYERDEERKLTPSNDEMLKQLDAYGHLNWTVGNEDWIACFDAVRHDDRIAYHVVVDCESGGFTDTLENDVIPISEIDKLRGLPDIWEDIAYENYLDQDETEYGKIESCRETWNRHLDNLRDIPDTAG